MRLIIVRHGETEWNRLRRTQGVTDIDLTVRGLRQARRLGYRLRGLPVKCVYTSPLKRALDTAKALAAPSRVPVVLDNDLKEIRFGDWEGMTFEEIGNSYPDELRVWNESPQLCKPPGESETLEEVAKRVQNFIRRARSQYEDGTVVAVSHTVPCKLLIALSIGLPLQNLHSLRMDNVSMSMIDFYEDKAVLRLFNDTTHLMEGVIWPKRS